MNRTMTAATLAYRALTEHPHYRYKGCAPDPDHPTQAAGNLDLTVDAWGPWTGDGPEPQMERHAREKAAIAVCGRCPVQALCAAYANTELTEVDEQGRVTVRLAEPEGILGGQRALERHRALIARRTAHTPDTLPTPARTEAGTPQKQAVLQALATELYEDRVAARAQQILRTLTRDRHATVDRRTANWHRASLCTLLGLDKETASRDDLILTALRHQLLPPGTRIVWDGLWPIAAAPNSDGSRQRRIAPDQPLDLLTPRPRPRTGHHPARRKTAPRPLRRSLRLLPTRTVPALIPTPALEPAA